MFAEQIRQAACAHDIFEWWSQIWIPLFVGLVTVGIAIAAVVTSHRATVIARDSEQARLSEIRRSNDSEARHRLLQMARDEARLLRRWLQLKWGYNFYGVGLGPVAAEKNPSIALTNAETALAQSLVPGAEDLLALTLWAADHIGQGLPEPEGKDEYGNPIDGNQRETEIQRRKDLIMERIREWALDPEGQANEVAKRLNESRSNPTGFWSASHQ